MTEIEALHRRARQGDGIIARTVGAETVLLNVQNEEYYTLDDIGSAVWSLLDGNRTLHEVAQAITADYDAEQDEVQRDVLALVEDLAHDQLVVFV